MTSVLVFLFSITGFIGAFHPLLVHLPIGILLIAVLFQLLSLKEKYKALQGATVIALFWGMISAIASCISGFLLSQSGDYDASMIAKHQWLGITTAVVSVTAYYLIRKNNKQLKWVMGLMALLIIITGHLGGSITHGSGYLTKAFSAENETGEIKRKPIPDIQEAAVYADLVQPLLEAKCYNCHGENKQKGKLRLDKEEFILKGGKDGKILGAGKTGESELIRRIFLPKGNEDHMPPKEKSQLAKEDMELLHWWISSGAGFNKKVKELDQPEKIKPLLTAIQSGGNSMAIRLSDIPTAPVAMAKAADVKNLNQQGITIVPVAVNSNYLAASFIAVDTITDQVIQLLEPLKEQLIWLKLGNTSITDAQLLTIAKLTSLTRLYLEQTAVTDKGIANLKDLSQLQYINLTGIKITAKGLEALGNLKNLKQLYLYQVGITAKEFGELKKYFPATMIDTGGYKIPQLATDTIEVKAIEK